jgi:hypothetical protein
MATAPSTDHQSQRSDLGHRFFLLGVFGVLVVEALSTIVNIGHGFIWTGTLLGAVSCLGILCLGNWLYAGDRAALTATRAWVLLQLILVAVATAILVSDVPVGSPIPHRLNITEAWQGWLKLLAYAGFATAVFLPGVVLEFLAVQRGETVAAKETAPAETPAFGGEPVTLANDQTQALEGLAGAMKMVSGLLILVGGLDVLAGLLNLGKSSAGNFRALNIVEGLPFLGLGLVLVAPIQALEALLSAAPRTMGHVMPLLTRLATTFAVYVLLFVALAVIIVWRLSM